MTQPPRPPALGYVIAIASVAAVAALRYAMAPVLGLSANFVMFTVPVVLAGWYNGLRPALLATTAGALFGAFLVPIGFSVESPRDVLGLAIFVVCGIVISALCESLHAAREGLRRQREALEQAAAQRQEVERRNLGTLENMGDAFHVIDANERFAYINPTARRLFESQGLDPDAMLGREVWEFFPEFMGSVEQQKVRQAQRDRVPSFFELYYEPWQRWFIVRVFPDPDGGIAVHLTDTTETHTLQAELEASAAEAHAHLRRLEGLYETAPIGLCELDRELRYVRINSALARMNGVPAAEHIGRTVREMVPELADVAEPAFRKVLETGIPVFEQQLEGYTSADPGVQHCWLESWYPICDAAGEVQGISVVAQDVTALKRAEESLRQSEEQLRLAVEAANLTAYEWDVVNGTVTRLGEVPATAPLGARYTFADLMETIHPDDRPSMLGRIEATLRGETDVYLSEHRSNENAEREWCWVRVRGRVIRGPEGSPLVMIGVAMDINEHKRMEEALREADQKKDDFLATLAHELRNPLAPIRNALYLLKAYQPMAAEVAHSRDVIDRQVRQMARLLDDLLDVSRIARGTLELQQELVDLRDVIDRALETSHPLIAERGHEIRVLLPDDDRLVLNADMVRLAQVFANLLNNAAKYMDDGGRILLRARRQGSDVLVSVEDTGIGIEAESLPTVFEMFTRGAPAAFRSRDGLGIGLSLARSIVTLHGGTLEATSAGQGQGSEFTVRLPLEARGTPVSPHVPELETVSSKPWRLVLADDLRDSADSLADLLRLNGHQVMTAYDGAEAVEATAQFSPEAVLLDIGMPKLDGYEACRQIRDLPNGRNLLVVALTGWGQLIDRERTRAAGFTHHLVKPVDYVTLLNVLNELRQSAAPVD